MKFACCAEVRWVTLLVVWIPLLIGCDRNAEKISAPSEQLTKTSRLYCESMTAFENEDGLDPHAAYLSWSSRSEATQTLSGSWTFVGPDVLPEEIFSNGKAIPSYAVNRGNGTGRINYLYQDPVRPNRLFACSPTGGLFISNDKGATWKNAGTDQLPVSGVSSVTVHPELPDTWIITTGDGDDQFMFSDGVWRTEDGGKNWVQINGKKYGKSLRFTHLLSGQLFISKVVSHPCDFNRQFIATNKGLYGTNNALDTPDAVKWKKLGDTFFYDIEVHPSDDQVLFAGGEEFMVSQDCGNSWKRLPNPPMQDIERYPFVRLNLECSSTDPNIIWVAATCSTKPTQASAGEGWLYKWHIKEKKWESVRSLRYEMNNLIPTRANAFAVSPQHDSLILVGNVQPVYRSTNGGIDFKRIAKNQMHDDIHHFLFDSEGERIWVAHDGGVSVSEDEGLTWVPSDNGIGVANIFGLSVAQTADTVLLFGAYDTGGNLLRNGNWYHVSWGDGFQTAIDPEDPNVMYASKQNGHLNRSDDGGINFDNAVGSGITRTEWHTWFRMSPHQPDVLFCAGDKLIRSVDKGRSWESILNVKDLQEEVQTIYRVFVSPAHEGVLYAYGLGKQKTDVHLYMSKNALEVDPEKIVWEKVPSPPKAGWISDLVVDADRPDQFWFSFKSAEPEEKLFRFNGERYIDVTANLGWCVAEALQIDPHAGERLYLGTNHGVYTRNKTEAQWTLIQGLPGTYIKSMDINHVQNQLYIGTFGRGVWTMPLISTSLVE